MRENQTWLATEARRGRSLNEIAAELQLRMVPQLRGVVDDDRERAFRHGRDAAVADAGGQIEWEQADEDALRQLLRGDALSGSYATFGGRVTQQLNQIIADSFAEQRSLDRTVEAMQKVVRAETWRLRRIARTEIVNVVNEGRARGYQQMERERGEVFRYTLVIAGGPRTCPAHRELAGRIPRRGLPMEELMALQQQVGGRHGLTLSGHALLHPNQRTVLARVP